MRDGHRTHPRLSLALIAAASVVAGSLSAARPAVAAFPGGNGAIAYTCRSTTVSGSEDICTMNADGSFQTKLTSGGHDRLPAWSPDGGRIAFSCGSAVCVIDPDGSNRTQLAGFGRRPTWSPDGSRIAFECNGICVMNADGSGQTQLTYDFDNSPSWSPDGTTIAFERDLIGSGFAGSDIYVMNADGSGQTQLTDGDYNFAPDWSPDGARIAFGSTRGGDHEQIYAMDADGSDVTKLTSGPDAAYGDPVWSPDGTKIAFDGGPDRPVVTEAIHVMNADGSDATDLTGDGTYWPDWQPLTATPGPFSDLALRMAGPRRIGPGDPITYSIRVRNQGPAKAEDVVVTDPLPPGTTFVRAHATHGTCHTPDPASATLSCLLGAMGDGSVRTIVVVCRAPSRETTVENTASGASETLDPNLHDNTATLVTRVG